MKTKNTDEVLTAIEKRAFKKELKDSVKRNMKYFIEEEGRKIARNLKKKASKNSAICYW